MTVIYSRRRVYAGEADYERILELQELQLAVGGWVREAIEHYADRSAVSRVSETDLGHLTLALASARTNWEWVQAAALPLEKLGLGEVATAFRELERSLHQNKPLSAIQRAHSSSTTRKILRRFLEEHEFPGVERIRSAFVTSLPTRPRSRDLISDDAGGAHPLGATPHKSKAELDQKLLARFELTRARIERPCEIEIDEYFDRIQRIAPFMEDAYLNEGLIQELLNANGKRIAHTRRMPQWLVDADPRELLTAYHAILLRHSPRPTENFACTRTGEMRDLLSAAKLLPERSDAVALDVMSQLTYAYTGTADTVVAAVLVLQLATGWNVSAVLEMTERDVVVEGDQIRIQGFKTKTGDATPPVYLGESEVLAKKAVRFLQERLDWMKKVRWIGADQASFWLSPTTIRNHRPAIYRTWTLMLRRFRAKHDLPKFTFEQVRDEVLAREAVRTGGLDAARRIGGHSSEVTTGHYLDQLLLRRRTSSIHLEFQRRIEQSVVYRMEANGELHEDDLLYPIGDGTSCTNPMDPPSAARTNDEACQAKACHAGGGCPNNRIVLNKERIEEVARTSRHYAANWKDMFARNPQRFERYDMPVFLFNAALRGVIATGPMRHELRQVEAELNKELG